MDGKRLLHSLRLENFLSYGPEGVQLELEPLNILIGQNASGKSNFVQAIELLRAAPTNLVTAIVQGGGVAEWLYKGQKQTPVAMIEVTVNYSVAHALLHLLDFSGTSSNQNLQITDESITGLANEVQDNFFYYLYERGFATLATRQQDFIGSRLNPDGDEWKNRFPDTIRPDQSILSQRSDPDSYPALNYLAEQYRNIKIYRGFSLEGRNSLRQAQQPDLPTDFLEEDGRNLSLVLNDLHYQGMMPTIVEKLRAVYEDVEDILVRVLGGTVQTFIKERGMNNPIPAARLSDGTLRYLCLLAILYHPTPPPLICLEEPEIGLHPDLISGLAKMLKEASQRTQLIVTTHSDLLVSKFSDTPEAVVVCERTPSGTTLQRLDAQRLGFWLEEYSLGEVWLKGAIGGTRW